MASTSIMEAFVFLVPFFGSAKHSRCSHQAAGFAHSRVGLSCARGSRSFRIRNNGMNAFSWRQNHGNLSMSLLPRPQFLQDWLSKLKACEPVWLARIGAVLVVAAIGLFELRKWLAGKRVISNQLAGVGNPDIAAIANDASGLQSHANKLSSLEFSRTEWEQGFDVSQLSAEAFKAKHEMKDLQLFSLSRSEWESLEAVEEIASMQPGMRKENPAIFSIQHSIDEQSPPFEAPSDISSARWTENRYSISFQRKPTHEAQAQLEDATNHSNKLFESEKAFSRATKNVQLANELAVNLSPWHLLHSFSRLCWTVFVDVLVPVCLIGFMAVHDYALRVRSLVDPSQESIFDQLSLVTLARPLGANASSFPSSSSSVDTSEKESHQYFDQGVAELSIRDLDSVVSFVMQTMKSAVSKVMSSTD